MNNSELIANIPPKTSILQAEKEIKLWFKKDELFPYKRVDEPLMYRKGKK